jgi:hypothetical protein
VEIEASNIAVGSDYYDCLRLVSAEDFLAERGEALENDFFEDYRKRAEEGYCYHEEVTDYEETGIATWLLGGLLTGPDEYADFFLSLLEDTTDVDISEGEIEGQDAICLSAEVSDPEGEGEGQFCFTNDGIPLLYTGEFSGPDGAAAWHMEATSFSRDVSDADFEPPYPVEE